MQTYQILRPDDACKLAMLHAGAFEIPWSPAALRSELKKPQVFGLGLMAPDAPERFVSFVLFQRVMEEAEMLTLATDPARQKKGHAKALLRTAFTHLAERGATRCLLDVAADNLPAIHLYRAMGFKQNGQRKAYYRRENAPAVDALLMTREIAGLP